MAVNHDPILKRCRTLGISPAVLGYDKSSNRNPPTFKVGDFLLTFYQKIDTINKNLNGTYQL